MLAVDELGGALPPYGVLAPYLPAMSKTLGKSIRHPLGGMSRLRIPPTLPETALKASHMHTLLLLRAAAAAGHVAAWDQDAGAFRRIKQTPLRRRRRRRRPRTPGRAGGVLWPDAARRSPSRIVAAAARHDSEGGTVGDHDVCCVLLAADVPVQVAVALAGRGGVGGERACARTN